MSTLTVAPVMLIGAKYLLLPSSTPPASSHGAIKAVLLILPSLHSPGMAARIALKPAGKSGAGQ